MSYHVAPLSRPLQSLDAQGDELEDFYPDMCVEGLEKDPF